ncbi:hypothetical protein HDU76_008772 [Blyttiomyces sp. JEL0837]|nr:hypothetical protein HDU76_008772 [Blyttiomyces sp. JEL0837]
MEEFLEGDALGGNSMNEGGCSQDMSLYVDVGNEEEVETSEDILRTAKTALDSLLNEEEEESGHSGEGNLEMELDNDNELIGFVDDHAKQVALAFPWLFPFGLDSSQIKFDDDDLKWFLNQFDQRIALCNGMVSYIWSVRLRKANILKVSRMWKNNPQIVEELQERIDNGLYEEIQDALKDPESEGSRKLVVELERLLSNTVLASPYSSGANKRALTAMIAMNRYFGPRHSYFVTVNPMVELNPLYKLLQGGSGEVMILLG